MLRKLAVVWLVVLFCGCVSMQYTAPDGSTVTYLNVGRSVETLTASNGPASVMVGKSKVDQNFLQQTMDVLNAAAVLVKETTP